MIVIILSLLGALIGGVTARRLKGNKLDMLQYAIGYALAFAVLGMVLTVIVGRLA